MGKSKKKKIFFRKPIYRMWREKNQDKHIKSFVPPTKKKMLFRFFAKIQNFISFFSLCVSFYRRHIDREKKKNEKKNFFFCWKSCELRIWIEIFMWCFSFRNLFWLKNWLFRYRRSWKGEFWPKTCLKSDFFCHFKQLLKKWDRNWLKIVIFAREEVGKGNFVHKTTLNRFYTAILMDF